MDWEDMQKKRDVAFGLEVRRRRDDLRITQKKLAKMIGLRQTDLSRYELGLKRCPELIRIRLEKVLGPIDVCDDEDVPAAPARDDAAPAQSEELPAEQTESAERAKNFGIDSGSPKQPRKRRKSENCAKIAQEFGLEMLRARMRLGMQQKDFAAAIGCPNSAYICKYERGQVLPKPDALFRYRKEIERLLEGGADNVLPAADGASDMRESAALHTEEAAAYDPEPASETVSGPLSAEEPQEEPRPFDGCQEVINRLTGRQGILLEKGLIRLSNDAFFRLCCYMKDLLGNKDNLDARFAGVGD